MKTIVITLTIIILASSNGPTLSASPSAPVEDGVKRREVFQGDVEIIENAIKRESLRLKIGNLKDSASNRAREIRIWIGLALITPRIFTMKELNGKRAAHLITFKDRRSLAPPKSGWNEFTEFLRNRGIDSPMRLSLDKRFEPDPDEEMIVVEVKSRGKYEMVFYLVSTRSEDGRKALEVCRRIEQEFVISMGCGVAQ